MPGRLPRREAADPAAWEYLARGSGAQVTANENVVAWSRWTLLPHVLRDVSTVDLSTSVLGTHVAAPILVAPTAMHRFFTADGELATARAAAEVGTVYVASMAATHSVEDVAAAAPEGARWAQMYMLRDRGRTKALAERAAAAGYGAIVASVDGAAVGRGIASASAGRLTPPDWMRYPNLASADDADSSDIMRLVTDFDPSITFDDLALFRRVEWPAGRGEGSAAGRRRRRVRSTPARRRSQCRTTAGVCSTASPPPLTCCRTWSTR